MANMKALILAINNWFQQFYKYLYGCHFLLRTDHNILMWLLRFKSSEGQVAKWIEHFQVYQFESVHWAGTSHRNADALSRRPQESCKHYSYQVTRKPPQRQLLSTSIGKYRDPKRGGRRYLKHLWAWRWSKKGRPTW